VETNTLTTMGGFEDNDQHHSSRSRQRHEDTLLLSPFKIDNVHFSGDNDEKNLEWDRFLVFLRMAKSVPNANDDYKKLVLFKMLKRRAQKFFLDPPSFAKATYDEVEAAMAAEFTKKTRATTATLQEIVQKQK
jgi:hypothetical protein